MSDAFLISVPQMKLNQLRDVLAIADRGSLRGAARHLALAQPALSRSVHELERELGRPAVRAPRPRHATHARWAKLLSAAPTQS